MAHHEQNDFAIAEEVTVKGAHDKRPDLVLYVNGIAVAVLELKRSSVSIEAGIRQNLDNQKPEFIRSFFTTMQLVMSGNRGLPPVACDSTWLHGSGRALLPPCCLTSFSVIIIKNAGAIPEISLSGTFRPRRMGV